jgi:hypothetical protein
VCPDRWPRPYSNKIYPHRSIGQPLTGREGQIRFTGMRYPTDLPRATRQDLSAAFASDDPLAFVDQQISAVDNILNYGNAEKTKWQKARAAVETFGVGAAQSHEAAINPVPTHANGAAARPKTRRSSLLLLFHEQPGREWRTRELAAELERRGWAGPSGNEANKVSRTLPQMVAAGEIEALEKKGFYRLRTQQPDVRPQTLEEASL